MTDRFGFDDKGQRNMPSPSGRTPADMSQYKTRLRVRRTSHSLLLHTEVWHLTYSGLRPTVPRSLLAQVGIEVILSRGSVTQTDRCRVLPRCQLVTRANPLMSDVLLEGGSLCANPFLPLAL